MVTQVYDRGLKNLFSHPDLLSELFKTFIHQDWVNELDFSRMQPLNIEHITEDLERRDNDQVWKIPVKDHWLYLLFMLEFQSETEEFMALRILTYCSLVFQDLLKFDKDNLPQKKLPPILSLVFYNGETCWNEPRILKDCFHSAIPKPLMKYQPNIEYIVIDVGQIPMEQYTNTENDDNLILSLIALEQASTPTEVKLALDRTSKSLKGKMGSLIRAFNVYAIKSLRLNEIYPKIDFKNEEEKIMLSKAVDQWRQELLQEGRQEGRQEGKQLGCRETIYKILLKILHATHPAGIPDMLMHRLETGTNEELEKWLDGMVENKLLTEELSDG